MVDGTEPGAPIACRQLTKHYGETRGVEDIELVVSAASITGFLGPNGAGKTTVIRMIVGLLRPTRGEVLLWGTPAAQAEVRRRLGYMPADPAFYLGLTGNENLDLLAALQGSASPDREWALELLELSPAALARPVGEYSSGMAQKLALVQAVQHRPDLVILDEPANRLDPLAHRRFEELVRAIAGDGRTVFLSSHTLSEVEDVCERVAMVRDGRLLAVRSVQDLAAAALRRVNARYSRAPDRLPEGLIEPRLENGQLTAWLARGEVATLRALLADEAIADVTIESGSLEDAFLNLYEGAAPQQQPATRPEPT